VLEVERMAANNDSLWRWDLVEMLIADVVGVRVLAGAFVSVFLSNVDRVSFAKPLSHSDDASCRSREPLSLQQSRGIKGSWNRIDKQDISHI
jgi:hypothetical protein